MNWKQIFRAVVCLLVVCCLLVNCMFPQVRAIEPVSTALGIGCAAALILMAAGVVFHPQTAADITAIGNSMTGFLDSWAVENDKVQEVQDWYFGIQFYDGGSDEDGDGEEDTPHQRQVTLARGILGGITAWVASVILAADSTITSSVTAPDGYAFWGGYLLPALSSYLSEEYDYYYVYANNEDLYAASNVMMIATKSYSLTCTLGLEGSTNYGTLQVTNNHSFAVTYEYFTTDTGTALGSQWVQLDGKTKSVSKKTSLNPKTDIYFLLNNPSRTLVKTIEQSVDAYVGDIPSQIKDGTLTADGITLPDVLDYTELVPFGKPAADAIIDTSQGLIDGTLSYEDYLLIIDKAADSDTDTEPDETAPSDPTDPVLFPGPLGDTDAISFLDALVRPFRNMFEWLGNFLLEGIKGLFVPSDGYIEAKVNTLVSEFAFANSIAQTGNAFKTFFVDMGMKPPIIYIDFSSARGSFSPSGQYALGGKAVFVDLTWYAEYKPTVDGLLSAFLWLWFCWRMLLSLPGILQGTSGMWGSGDSLAGFEPWSIPRRLDSGSSGRLLGTSEHHQRFNSERKRFWER